MTKKITIIVRSVEIKPHPETLHAMQDVLDSAVSVAQESANLTPGLTVEVVQSVKD